jgi:hypothetical protein
VTIHIIHYPIILHWAPALHSNSTNVVQYSDDSAASTGSISVRQNPKLLEVVVEKGTVSPGSCGGPYFNDRGHAFAFHVASTDESSDNADDDLSSLSDESHVSFNVGRVFCRLPKFMSSWKELNTIAK